jgi:hypothetical protein
MKLAALLCCALLSGCATGGVLPRIFRPAPASARVTTEHGAAVEQRGVAQVPAKATVTTGTVSVPLPAATAVEIAPKTGSVTFRLDKPTVATVTTRTEHAEAPRAFAPPASPTPSQLAEAGGVRNFWIASLACLALAGLSAWRAHFLAAVCFGLAGVALPILARFFTSATTWAIGAVLLAIGGALFVAWHILAPKLNPPRATV